MSTDRRAEDRAGYPPPAVTAAVLAILAVVLGVVAVGAIVDTSARATETVTAVEVTVLHERTEEQTTIGRRGSITAPYRVVAVELPSGGLAELRSDDLEVGSTATVYRTESGRIVEAPPPPPGALEWGLCTAAAAAAVVLAIAAIRAAGRARRKPSGSEPPARPRHPLA